GVRVTLPRSRSSTVGLDTRAAIANNNQADVFISLHANASLRPAAAGTAVYYLSIDEYGVEAREIANRAIDPVPVVGGGSREIDLVHWEMAQIRYVGQAGRLAGMIEEELGRRVPLSPRPSHQAPLRVLVGANMPAVLVELGSIADPDAEERLTSALFQTDIVDALVTGIQRYSDDLGRARQFAPRLAAPGRSADAARRVREQ
ncbi:MAG: N-acetylmuramoyl-L-alanine amidase, partial [Acidobacteria bacterium]|nr:N-acetylmuramoyl-L-alanine amidase [Acidobacteriota bacterium]